MNSNTYILNGQNQLVKTVLEYTQDTYNRYIQRSKDDSTIVLTYTNEELLNETWKSLNDIPSSIKDILDSSWISFLTAKHSLYVSNLGRISKLENNMLILKNCVNDADGYRLAMYNHNVYRINRLVGIMFIPLTMKDGYTFKEYTIDHINFNRVDNRISNLQWLLNADNARKKNPALLNSNVYNVKHTKHTKSIVIDNSMIDNKYIRARIKQYDSKLEEYGYIKFTKDELDNEQWICLTSLNEKYKSALSKMWLSLYDYDGAKNYYISNLGRIVYYKRAKDEFVLKTATTNKDGYKKVYINDYSLSIHRLIGLLFIPIDNLTNDYEIHHKNFNVIDNRVTNLEWMKGALNATIHHGNVKAGNTKNHVSMLGISKNVKLWEPIVKLNVYSLAVERFYLIEDELVKDYSNVEARARIKKACTNNRDKNDYKHISDGSIFLYLSDYNKLFPDKAIALPSVSLICTNVHNKFIKEYNSLEEIIDDGYDISKVYSLINMDPKEVFNNTKYGYFKWFKKKDYDDEKIPLKWYKKEDYLMLTNDN